MQTCLGNRASQCGISSDLQYLRVHSKYLGGMLALGSKKQSAYFSEPTFHRPFPTPLSSKPQSYTLGSISPILTSSLHTLVADPSMK